MDASLMRTPPANYFYRLVAVNESGRSDPSPIFPLRLPAMDTGAPVDPGASIDGRLICDFGKAPCSHSLHHTTHT